MPKKNIRELQEQRQKFLEKLKTALDLNDKDTFLDLMAAGVRECRVPSKVLALKLEVHVNTVRLWVSKKAQPPRMYRHFYIEALKEIVEELYNKDGSLIT